MGSVASGSDTVHKWLSGKMPSTKELHSNASSTNCPSNWVDFLRFLVAGGADVFSTPLASGQFAVQALLGLHLLDETYHLFPDRLPYRTTNHLSWF